MADDGDDPGALRPGERQQLVGKDDVGLATDAIDDDGGVGPRGQLLEQGTQGCDADAGSDEHGAVAGRTPEWSRP